MILQDASFSISERFMIKESKTAEPKEAVAEPAQKHTPARLTFITSCFALIAFAANSVLCRLALGESSIDPASFTIIRMISGAITLIVMVLLFPQEKKLSMQSIFSLSDARSWLAPIMLFIYAIFFSYAYVKLNTASGALILFATVQFTMIGVTFLKGNRLRFQEWLGIIISFAGFVLLMLPSATQPSIIGFSLMLVAGVAWAFYTLEGKKSSHPILNTTENFVRCIPLALCLLVITFWSADITLPGVWYAIASGSIASGIGYSVWYLALRNLSITQAAISQLSVPLIAAVGGVIFVNEALSNELIFSGVLILSGIAIVTLNKVKSEPHG